MGYNKFIYLFSIMPIRPINLIIVKRPSPKRGKFNIKPNTNKVVRLSLVD